MTVMPLTYGILPLRNERYDDAQDSQPSDMNLLKRIQTGDEDALLALHKRYANLVYSVAYRILGDNMAAEEVTQDTFVRVWNKSLSFDPQKGRFVTWLLTVTRRIAIDALRSRQRREPKTGMLFMDEDPNLWENVLSTDGGGDMRRMLKSALNQLPTEQRDLIEMVYFYGLSHSDIADMSGIPLGTVKTRIRLGMQKLRQAWLTEKEPKQDFGT